MPTSPATTSRVVPSTTATTPNRIITTTTSTTTTHTVDPSNTLLHRQNTQFLVASILVTLCSLTCLIAFVIVYVVYVVVSLKREHENEQTGTTTINWEGFYSWPLYVVIVSVVLFVLSLILLIKRYQLMIRRRMEQRQQAEVERMELERAMNAETIRVPTTISGSGTMVEMKLPPNANVRDFRQDGSTMHGTHEQTQMDQPYVMREPGVVMPSTSNVQPIQLGVNHESQQPAVQYTFNNNLPPSIV